MDTPIPPNAPPDLSDEESRKKYIRTFAGDMEIVKKGGTPDLKPLEETSPAPFAGAPQTIEFTPSPEPVPAPEPIPTPVEQVPPPTPPAPTPEPTLVPRPTISINPPPSYREPIPAPPAPIRPAPPVQFPDPTPVRAPEINAAPLETYAGDFVKKVQDTNASPATVLAAEEDAGATPIETAPKKTSGWTIFAIIAGVVLLIGGGVGAYIGYEHYLVKTAPVIIAPTITAPIFVDAKEKIVADSPADTLSAIIASTNETLAPNAVRLLYTDISTTTGNDIFSALQFPAPGILLRNIVASSSMAGIVNANGTASPFFIISVTSYQDTFAGMLAWEATMPNDLSALFPLYPPLTPPTVATTTPATTTPPKSKTKTKTVTPKVATSTPIALPPAPAFQDEIVDNHNVRIYLDSTGRSIFIYGYWNQNTLVIARDPASFTEIINRLDTSGTQ